MEAGCDALRADGIKVRVVSAPSEGLFRGQSKEYQESVLPKNGLKTHEDSLAYVNKLKDIFAKDETNEVVLDGLNSMYSSLKMEKEQTELLDAAIAKNPNNFVALDNKGMMYIQNNDADNAIKCLKQARAYILIMQVFLLHISSWKKN